MSFRLKTILGIGIIQVLLLSVLITSVLNFLHETGQNNLINDATTKIGLIANASDDAVLSNDLAALESTVEETLENPQIIYLRILSNDAILAEGGLEYFADKENQFDTTLSEVSDGVLDIEKDIEVSGISYGKIQMGYSTHAIDNIFIEIRQWTITIALIMVILVAVFSYFLGNYLTMQINKINAAAEIISKKGPGFQIAVEGNDEIATMSKAFNNMSLSLKDSYEQLEQGLAIQNDLLISASENESKIQAILESSLDALIIIDQNGIIEEFNPQAEEIFGWRRNEVFGKPMTGFIVPEEQRKAHTRGMDHYNKTGEGPIIGKRLELNALHRNGHEFPVELTISNIKIDQKELFAAFIRDISDRKATETELRLSARAFDSIEAMFITCLLYTSDAADDSVLV